VNGDESKERAVLAVLGPAMKVALLQQRGITIGSKTYAGWKPAKVYMATRKEHHQRL
jgi:hypothetical protein